jgi:hypothetical protein
MAYNTPDSFEKVYEFFRSKGTDEQRAHRVKPGEKFAMIMFQDTGYTVTIGWKESAKSDGLWCRSADADIQRLYERSDRTGRQIPLIQLVR